MSSSQHVDGNAVAGPLAEIFGRDVTAAFATCASCAYRAPLAELAAYIGIPGLVLRCPGCQDVLLAAVISPTRTWLHMSGIRALELEP